MGGIIVIGARIPCSHEHTSAVGCKFCLDADSQFKRKKLSVFKRELAIDNRVMAIKR